MSLRDQRREATRLAIADAARDLLEQGGADALTFRAIAERVGVSVGTVVNHVGSKAELVVGLFVADLSRAMEAHHGRTVPSDRVERLADRFLAFFEIYAARPSLARRTILEVAFAPDEAFSPYLALTIRFVVELATWIEAEEELRPHVAPLVAARALFDTYIGVVVLFLREEEPDASAGLAALRVSFAPLVSALFVP